jgi:hypothetical protein
MEEHTRSRGSEVPRSELTAGTRKGKAEGESPPVPFICERPPGYFFAARIPPAMERGHHQAPALPDFFGIFGLRVSWIFWVPGLIGSLQVEKRTYGLRQGSGRHSERTIPRTDWRPIDVPHVTKVLHF